ncbi:hypothetical protein O5O45_07970 [Hahella aquimaris]|uniref:hypothetical protein n=1 Tax=Hahella sp. HNIBRBA332 TaxID=3015983 RepID=UPI00273B6157|nr:hypothetical protein [Hahella sp. HNIBRBA332]WLQ15849.1 hypothetical protein O5O45_07970 [Hahella sp. HNIBRBA332]
MNIEEQEKIIGLLGSMAMYNDKGIHWTDASPEKAAQVRDGFRKAIDNLIAEIGQDNIPQQVLTLLRSDKVLVDGQGSAYTEARRLFKSLNA